MVSTSPHARTDPTFAVPSVDPMCYSHAAVMFLYCVRMLLFQYINNVQILRSQTSRPDKVISSHRKSLLSINKYKIFKKRVSFELTSHLAGIFINTQRVSISSRWYSAKQSWRLPFSASQQSMPHQQEYTHEATCPNTKIRSQLAMVRCE